MANAFYEYMESLWEKGLTEDEINEALLVKLEEVLSKRDAEADWLAYHYDGACEVLYEGTYMDDEEYTKKLNNDAKREIEIFRKTGYTRQAKWMESLLAEIVFE